MTATTTSCDVCKKVKKETNHWFRCEILRLAGVKFITFAALPYPERRNTSDLCGEECAHKALSQWFEFVGQRSPEP